MSHHVAASAGTQFADSGVVICEESVSASQESCALHYGSESPLPTFFLLDLSLQWDAISTR
jgi:hypothetical protein